MHSSTVFVLDCDDRDVLVRLPNSNKNGPYALWCLDNEKFLHQNWGCQKAIDWLEERINYAPVVALGRVADAERWAKNQQLDSLRLLPAAPAE